MESILTKFMSNQSRLLILICMLFFISISCVSAADNTLSMENNTNDHINAGFDVLQNDINNLNPGDVYNIDKDYTFNYNSPIPILGDNAVEIGVDNVTINGNGHVIDGNFKTSIFKITGNNVKILDLTFTNSKYSGFNIPIQRYDVGKTPGPLVFKEIDTHYQTDSSPICWLGDNGSINNCLFYHNTAINGGAISWMGNNGIINNTCFIDNIARGVAGAIYIGAVNNITVVSCDFINSTSLLSGEAIFLDRKHGNYTFSDNEMSNQDVFGIEGASSNIDVEYLKYDLKCKIGDEEIDIIPYIYCSIMNGKGNINENISYFAQYSKDQGIFVWSAIYKESGKYNRVTYMFTNTTLNDVFKNAVDGNFKVETIKGTTEDGKVEQTYHASNGEDEKKTPSGNSRTVIGWIVDAVMCVLDLMPQDPIAYIWNQLLVNTVSDAITGDWDDFTHLDGYMRFIPSHTVAKEIVGVGYIIFCE